MRGPLLVLTWIVATVLATGLAWAGVRSVVEDVAAPLPVPAATTGQAGPSEGPPANEVSPEPSSGASEPEAPSGSSPEESEPAQPAEIVQTFELYGGTATVRFSPSGAEVLSAVPKPGFSADVEPENTGMRVEFESDDHRSRLDVWWNGEPRHETEERDDDGGSSSGPGEDDDDGGGDDDHGDD